MTGYQTLLVEKRGSVEWLTLNRPERLNTITGTMVRDLVQYLQSKLSDIDTRVIVMRGAGRASCAGLDIKERVDGGDTVEFHAGEPQLTDIVPLCGGFPSRSLRCCTAPPTAAVSPWPWRRTSASRATASR